MLFSLVPNFGLPDLKRNQIRFYLSVLTFSYQDTIVCRSIFFASNLVKDLDDMKNKSVSMCKPKTDWTIQN